MGGGTKLQQRAWSPGTAGQARVPTYATYLPAGAWLEPPLGQCSLFASICPIESMPASEVFLRPLLPPSAVEGKEAYAGTGLPWGSLTQKACKERAAGLSEPGAHILFTFGQTAP